MSPVGKYTNNPLILYVSVPVVINGGPPTPEAKTLPKHKKNPEIGEKQTIYTSTILLEQEDAVSFEDQEEVGLSYGLGGLTPC
jgi:hypothetical protein